MKIRAIRTRIFREAEDIIGFVTASVKKPKDGSIVVITSKIVALSESRVGDVSAKEAIIKKESSFALNTKYAWLTIKDGTVMANAGVDESNADGKLVLLPKDSFKAAARIRLTLKKEWRLRRLGILITDSRLMPLRSGVVGVALGYAGFKGLRDYRGKRDIFGRVLKMSQTDVADSLATSAVLIMGEGDERQPLAVIEDAPVEFTGKSDQHELTIALVDDLYYPLFQKAKRAIL